MTDKNDEDFESNEESEEHIFIESGDLPAPEERPLPKEVQRKIIESLNRDREKTRSRIAVSVISIFGATLLACFSVLAVSVFHEKADKALAKDLAIILLNPATGLAAGAVGFYLGYDSKKSK
jgi:hypothetical protein